MDQPFTPEEDNVLIHAVDDQKEEFSGLTKGRRGMWLQIAKRIPGRTNVQVHNRYAGILNKSRKGGTVVRTANITAFSTTDNTNEHMKGLKVTPKEVSFKKGTASVKVNMKDGGDAGYMNVDNVAPSDRRRTAKIEAQTMSFEFEKPTKPKRNMRSRKRKEQLPTVPKSVTKAQKAKHGNGPRPRKLSMAMGQL